MPAKTSAKSTLEQLQTVAFFVTVGSAILYGLMAGFDWLGLSLSVSTVDTLNNVLFYGMCGGGITMGLLYVYKKLGK